MNSRISKEAISEVISKAIALDYFSDSGTVIFHDLTFLKERFKKLKALFPDNTLHAIAAKANPLPALLEYMQRLGAGCEAATIGEVYLALKSGYKPSKIVFDSPAKTIGELEFALEKGIHINADSFNEVDRIATLLKKIKSDSTIGLRINPQSGAGKILFTSVADTYSKFGVPLSEKEDRILEYYVKYEWLTGIHYHIGSQGNSLEQLASPAVKIIELLEKIPRSLSWIDIGGGLPVNYSENDNAPSLEDYCNLLMKNSPELFHGAYRIITEFGRSIHANSGWTASKVEYVKEYSGITTAVIHVGADLFLRRIYQPEHWHHDISVFDSRGYVKKGRRQKYTIAGPLCFNGDIITRDIELPHIEEGDFIIIHDSGGYTLGMWSRHTSRLIPKVLGYSDDGHGFQILKNQETLEELYNFWR